MTLRPHHDHVRFVATAGPAYPRDAMCANPWCHKPAEQEHHVWSRKQLGKPSDWVLDTATGDLIPNKIGVCDIPCHRDLTGGIGGHGARVQYLDEEKSFYWIDLRTSEGAPIETFQVGSVSQRADWLRAQGRDEDADALLGDAA